MTPSSPWEPGSGPVFPKLATTLDVDVAIVGGGIAGLMAAYQLTTAGKTVALLEQGRLAEGASGWTTAFATYVTDASLAELERKFGAQAGLAWKAGSEAIDELERIIAAETIACDFMRCPAYIFASDEDGLRRLREEEKLARASGFSIKLESAPLGIATPGYLHVKNQAKFHPVKFLNALARLTAERGARIFEHSKATRMANGLIQTVDGEVRASEIILATGKPFGPADGIFPPVTATQTYVMEMTIPKDQLPEAIYWDTSTPYRYFRIDRLADHDRMILGGEDRKPGQDRETKKRFANLETYLQRLLPGMPYDIVRQWSGEVLETTDGLPYIGRAQARSHAFLATGFSGNGMTFGTTSGLLLRDLIMGKTNALQPIFDPGR